MRNELAEKVDAAVGRLVSSGRLPEAEYPKVEISDTKSAEHGDFACNFALTAAKAAGSNPRALAELLATELSDDPEFDKVEVAGPGFVNLTLSAGLTARALAFVLQNPENFYRPNPKRRLKINVEFVSVNPNGPITVGSGRGAAYGSALCKVLEAAGHAVHKEYYINDGVNSEQMRLFAESVRAILEGRPVPDNGYKGDYVHDSARQVSSLLTRHGLENLERGFISGDFGFRGTHASTSAYNENRAKQCRQLLELVEQHGERRAAIPHLDLAHIQFLSEWAMTSAQSFDLKAFGVEFDTWFSEQSLHDSGAVGAEIDHLVRTGAADDKEYRTKVKFGKGGTIEEVEVENQASEDDEGPVTPTPDPSPSRGAGGGDSDLETEIAKRQMTSEGGVARVNETLWLRSTKFGDDMDRVLRRRDGRLTYIASDVAYHKDKFNRGTKPDADGQTEAADKLITVLGPDHHGYIGRLHAVVAADLLGAGTEGQGSRVEGQEAGEHPSLPEGRGESPFSENDAKVWKDADEKRACLDALVLAKERLEVLIFQLVRFVKDGKPAPMRKRDGNIYALIDLIDEIGEKVQPDGSQEEKRRAGRDVARFFYLMRSHDTTFDFDLDLAEKQSEDNPVFYAQYAHARICGVLRKAEEQGQGSRVKGQEADLTLLTHPKEKALIIKLQDLGNEVERCAEDYAVNRLTTYAVELARTYHHFYDACRVVQPEEPELSAARLSLCVATRHALRATFGLLGISAPERM